MDDRDKTMLFRSELLQGEDSVESILKKVYQALQEKGYNPNGQLVGYLMSGDPTFITSHRNARTLISRLDRDVILEKLVAQYFEA